MNIDSESISLVQALIDKAVKGTTTFSCDSTGLCHVRNVPGTLIRSKVFFFERVFCKTVLDVNLICTASGCEEANVCGQPVPPQPRKKMSTSFLTPNLLSFHLDFCFW